MVPHAEQTLILIDSAQRFSVSQLISYGILLLSLSPYYSLLQYSESCHSPVFISTRGASCLSYLPWGMFHTLLGLV